jgi:ceramide glucosyltransferase
MSCFKTLGALSSCVCFPDDDKAADRQPAPRMNALGAITVLLAVPAVASAAYFWIAAAKLRQWLDDGAAEEADAAGLPSVTFLRPLKAGVPDLFGKLVTLARALRPGDQLVIGATPDSAELVAAEALRRSFPELDIAVVPCAPGGAVNPKIAKLVQMEPLARHEHWILSDSEAITDVDFMSAFRREWTRCDVLTAGYRFRGVTTWPQRLDAVAALLALWPGLAMLRAFGRVRLTLGACTGFRRGDVQAVGGWSAFADELAEDNRLGKALAAAGRTIRLSRHVATLECDALSWRDYWRHQRRVAVTYRVANPSGFAGAFLSQGVTAGLLLVCLLPAEVWAWCVFAGVFASRYLTARSAGHALAFPLSPLAPVVLLASLVETACWALSWGTRFVWWGGVRWRVSRDGRITRAGAAAQARPGAERSVHPAPRAPAAPSGPAAPAP